MQYSFILIFKCSDEFEYEVLNGRNGATLARSIGIPTRILLMLSIVVCSPKHPQARSTQHLTNNRELGILLQTTHSTSLQYDYVRTTRLSFSNAIR